MVRTIDPVAGGGSHGLPLHEFPTSPIRAQEKREWIWAQRRRDTKYGPDVMLMLLQGSGEEAGNVVLSHGSQAYADSGCQCSTLAHHRHPDTFLSKFCYRTNLKA